MRGSENARNRCRVVLGRCCNIAPAARHHLCAVHGPCEAVNTRKTLRRRSLVLASYANACNVCSCLPDCCTRLATPRWQFHELAAFCALLTFAGVSALQAMLQSFSTKLAQSEGSRLILSRSSMRCVRGPRGHFDHVCSSYSIVSVRWPGVAGGGQHAHQHRSIPAGAEGLPALASPRHSSRRLVAASMVAPATPCGILLHCGCVFASHSRALPNTT